MVTEKEHQIIGLIYDAILNHKWNDVLAEIVAYTQSYSGFFTVFDQLDPASNFIYTHNILPELVKVYIDEEIRVVDMQVHKPQLQQAGGVGHALAFDWKNYENMPTDSNEYLLYDKCIRPSGLQFVVGILLEEGNYRWGLLGIHRTKTMQFYSEKECIQLENLALHIRRALQIYRQFNIVQQKYYDLYQILDRLNTGVILVNSKAKLLYTNGIAKNILENSTALLWVDRYNQLKTKPHFQNQLNRFILSSCFETLNLESIGGAMILYEEMEHPLLKLSVTPLTHSSTAHKNNDNEGQAMIFISTIQQQYLLATTYLGQTYNLTKRELTICELFVNGKSLKDIAKELGVTLSSLRTYFKYIYEKTHCASQTELMYLLMNITLDFEHVL